MENKEVALGTTSAEKQTIMQVVPTTALSERINILTSRVDELTRSFNAMHVSVIKDQRKPPIIPAGTLLFGKSAKKETILVVTETGFFIGKTRYNSLSAAAKTVSGMRRSGWTFWKTANGKTAKEVFNN